MLNIGLSSRVLSAMTVAEAAAFMQKEGFRCTELCFTHPELSGWLYNGIGSLENITPQKVKESADIFRSRGVDVVSLGLYTDLRDPDPARRRETLDYCRRYIELAAAADIPYIATQCGFTPGHRGVNADSYEADYVSVRDGLQQICREAEQSGVHMVLEACMLDIIPSPRRLKTLIEELEAISHVRLGALIDPSNFIANSDEEGMFCYLKHDVAYCHGKDRKLSSVSTCELGDGDVDWVKFMECYIRFADKKPFILEDCPIGKCAELKNGRRTTTTRPSVPSSAVSIDPVCQPANEKRSVLRKMESLPSIKTLRLYEQGETYEKDFSPSFCPAPAGLRGSLRGRNRR